MRFEPPIERARLLEAAGEVYGLDGASIEFVPLGLGSACYDVRSTEGARFFIKLWTHLERGTPATERQHATLVLTRAMHERAIDVRVPYPLLTRSGELWTHLDGMPFALHPWLDGSMPESPRPLALHAEVGRVLGTLHRAAPALEDVAPGTEAFEFALAAMLEADLSAPGSSGGVERPGLRSAREWAGGHADFLRAQLARLRSLRGRAEAIAAPFVLAHRDLHSHNMLVDTEGVAFLDWDDALLAPPEQDIAMCLWDEQSPEGFRAALEGYWDAGGTRELRIEQVEFYLVRRVVEDTALMLHQLLEPGADPREDTTLLEGLDAWGGGWARLDDALEVARHALSGSVG